MAKTIDNEVMEILRRTEFNPENQTIVITEQLDRALYVKVDKVLKLYNGKWDRKLKGHRFPTKADLQGLATAIGSGKAVDAKKERQAFYTPADLAAHVVTKASVAGCAVLEPSAGRGALVREALAQGAASVDAIELAASDFQVLCGDFIEDDRTETFVQKDFLTTDPIRAYDRVVMNPPFSKNQDVKHVTHALRFLKPGGKLVAIMWPNKTRKPFVKLVNDWIAAGGDVSIEDIEAGRFKESGTQVATMLVTFTQ